MPNISLTPNSNSSASQPSATQNYMRNKAPDVIIHILQTLRKHHPDASCDLIYKTPFELLAMTIMATQCSVRKVNAVAPQILAKYPTPEAFSQASRSELERLLRPTGFYRQKAKFLQETSRILIDHYDNKIPDSLLKLTQLPGIARKAGNLLLGELYQKAEGIVVDTTIQRVATRLGLSNGKSATKVEQDLMQIVPQTHWIELGHVFQAHGNTVCRLHQPQCKQCPLQTLCPVAPIAKQA